MINIKKDGNENSGSVKMENLPILYSFVRCPYAMRARMALLYSGIKCYIREVDLQNKPVELLSISPKGTVPVLQLPSDQVIEESLDIVYYSVASNDPDKISDVSDAVQGQIKELIRKNDQQFIPLLVKYKYFNRFPEEPQASYLEQIEQLFLQILESSLQNSAYLMGERRSVADIAIIPFIRQLAIIDLNWFEGSKYTNILRWLKSFTDTPEFATVMKKYPPWQVGSLNISL